MEEIRLWRSGSGKGLRSVEAIPELETEVALEDLLVANPELLEDGLTLVGRQTPTVGGWLDLLGVDRGGRLVIFELKRGALGRDAVTQVLDYASAISAMEVEALVEHMDARSADGGMDRIPDFRSWYEETFDDLQRLFPVRMALVGLGVDETALRIARFLEEGGRPIEVIIFHGFRRGTALRRPAPGTSRRPPLDGAPLLVSFRPSGTTVRRRDLFREATLSGSGPRPPAPNRGPGGILLSGVSRVRGPVGWIRRRLGGGAAPRRSALAGPGARASGNFGPDSETGGHASGPPPRGGRYRRYFFGKRATTV